TSVAASASRKVSRATPAACTAAIASSVSATEMRTPARRRRPTNAIRCARTGKERLPPRMPLVYQPVHSPGRPGGDVSETARARRPLKEGYFTVPDDPAEPPKLQATVCNDCGEYFFPKRAVCAKCLSENTADALRSEE